MRLAWNSAFSDSLFSHQEKAQLSGMLGYQEDQVVFTMSEEVAVACGYRLRDTFSTQQDAPGPMPSKM